VCYSHSISLYSNRFKISNLNLVPKTLPWPPNISISRAMSHSDEQLSFLRSLIHGRRFSLSNFALSIYLSLYLSSHLTFHFIFRSFCDATIRFLESLLVSKDVKSFIEVRSSLTDFLRSESLSVIRSIASKTVHEKLLVLEFFVRAFALVGDQQVF